VGRGLHALPRGGLCLGRFAALSPGGSCASGMLGVGGLAVAPWAVGQNHRMVGVGRDLCGSPSPTLLPKQGHLQQAVEDLVQAELGYQRCEGVGTSACWGTRLLHHLEESRGVEGFVDSALGLFLYCKKQKGASEGPARYPWQ